MIQQQLTNSSTGADVFTSDAGAPYKEQETN